MKALSVLALAFSAVAGGGPLLGAENVKRLDAVLDDSLEAVPAAG